MGLTGPEGYVLEEQIGFLLRKANQRHRAIFNAEVDGKVAPPQFSVLVKLSELGPTSQNQLGRMVALDSATMTGVIKRLRAAGLVDSSDSVDDARMRILALTDEGRAMVDELMPAAVRITELTLSSLTAAEARTLSALLGRIAG